jgi:hypothetical protein
MMLKVEAFQELLQSFGHVKQAAGKFHEAASQASRAVHFTSAA